MHKAYFDLLLSVLPQVVIGCLLLMFWWPMRGQAYGKSLLVVLGVGVVSFLIGHIANPTLIGNYLPLVQGGAASKQLLFKIHVFWSVCESLFAILLVALLLSDALHLLPAEVRANMDILRPLEWFYRHIFITLAILLILRILPAAVLYYQIHSIQPEIPIQLPTPGH